MELSEASDISLKHVQTYLRYARQTLSLDARLGEKQETELGDLLEDPSQSPNDYTVRSSLRDDLDNLMVDLTGQQRQVLALRFGLEDGKGLTLAKIGELLNVSRERVRQIERDALKSLRQRKGALQEYLV